MTRDDVKKTFPEATDEQVKALMDIHGADIERTKAAAGTDAQKLKTLEADLTAAKETIKSLESANGDAAKLKKELEDYRQAEADRKKAEDAAQARAAVEARFNSAVGERKFVHEFVRNGVLGEFEKALSDKANEGKGDKDVFDQLTRDKDYFASMNPPAPNMGGIGGDNVNAQDARAVMGLPPVEK